MRVTTGITLGAKNFASATMCRCFLDSSFLFFFFCAPNLNVRCDYGLFERHMWTVYISCIHITCEYCTRSPLHLG